MVALPAMGRVRCAQIEQAQDARHAADEEALRALQKKVDPLTGLPCALKPCRHRARGTGRGWACVL
jgi:hypothetical protein